MELGQLLSWLERSEPTALEETTVVALLESVLEAYPEERAVSSEEEELLEAIEDLLDREEGEAWREALDWPARFAGLLPEQLSPLDAARQRLDELAASLPEERLETERLRRFSELLTEAEERGLPAVAESLAELAQAISSARQRYEATEFSPDQVTAEAVVAHHALLAGFEAWAEAFLAAGEEDWDGAWSLAVEGNRYLLAVSLWSDALQNEAPFEVGQA